MGILSWIPGSGLYSTLPNERSSRESHDRGGTNPFAVHAGMEMLRAGVSAADAALTTVLAQVALDAGATVSYAGIFTAVYYVMRRRWPAYCSRSGYSLGRRARLVLRWRGNARQLFAEFSRFRSTSTIQSQNILSSFPTGESRCHMHVERNSFLSPARPPLQFLELRRRPSKLDTTNQANSPIRIASWKDGRQFPRA